MATKGLSSLVSNIIIPMCEPIVFEMGTAVFGINLLYLGV